MVEISRWPPLLVSARHQVAPWLRYLGGHRYWCRRSPTPDRPSPACTRPGCAGRLTPKSVAARERHPVVMNGGTRPVCPNRGCRNCPSCPTIVFKLVGARRLVALDRLGHGTVRMCPRCPKHRSCGGPRSPSTSILPGRLLRGRRRRGRSPHRQNRFPEAWLRFARGRAAANEGKAKRPSQEIATPQEHLFSNPCLRIHTVDARGGLLARASARPGETTFFRSEWC
jgi:hypothetical protein